MKSLSDFKLHVFDLDDTLINTRYSYKNAQKTAISKLFGDTDRKEFLASLMNLRWFCGIFGSGNVRQYFKAFLATQPNFKKDSSDLLDKLLETYYFVFWEELKSFDGVVDFLSLLGERGKTLALVSNGNSASQEKKLRGTNLKVFFDDELCLYSGNFPDEYKKPSPYMLKLVCDKARVAPEEAVFYGNTEGDVLAANLAGVASVFYGNLSSLSPNLPFIAIPDISFKSWTEYIGKFEF